MKSREPIIPPGQDQWFRLIDILQNELKLDVYPGGYSAMTGWHYRHDWIFNPSMERLYGTDVDKIPENLLSDKRWKRKFYLYQSDWFPKNLGIDRIKTRGYELRIPCLERSLLEMVYNINKRITIDTVFNYFMDLPQINPKKIQKLLEQCSSEKIKRFGLFLAEETYFDYFKKIDSTNIKLNLNKNLDITDGHHSPNYVFKYNIDVPGHLDWEACEYKRYYSPDERPARAI